jgi:hypothetical protein
VDQLDEVARTCVHYGIWRQGELWRCV